MAGHNKWSKVKRKKEVLDAKKSKVFSEFARQLAIASREARGDVKSPTLRAIIEKARGVNMPNENIERAVEKGAGRGSAAAVDFTYEAYGPGGVALIIRGAGTNTNKSAQEIKHILSEHGNTLAAPGSALWAFTKTNEGFTANTKIPLSPEDTEKLSELLETLTSHEDVLSVYTNEEA